MLLRAQRVRVDVRCIAGPGFQEVFPVEGNGWLALAGNCVWRCLQDVGLGNLVLHWVSSARHDFQHERNGRGDIAGVTIVVDHSIATTHADRSEIATTVEDGGEAVGVNFPTACAAWGAGKTMCVNLVKIFGQFGRHIGVVSINVACAVVGRNVMTVSGQIIVFDKYRVCRSELECRPSAIPKDDDAVAEVMDGAVVVVNELTVINYAALPGQATDFDAGEDELREFCISDDKVDATADQSQSPVFAVAQVGADQRHVGKFRLPAIAAVKADQIGIARDRSSALQHGCIHAGALERDPGLNS